MNFDYEVRQSYLYKKVTGEFDIRKGQDSIEITIQKCIDFNLSKVLVDLSELQGENTRFGRYFLLDALGKQHNEYVKSGYQPISVAFVGSEKFLTNDGYEERVAKFYSFRLKTTAAINVAEAWLNS